MEAALRVAPLQGETTWSFLHRVAAAYGMEAVDLLPWWRWASSGAGRRSGRPDREVLLNPAAQEMVAGWCGVQSSHLARALPSWAAGPAALAGRDSGQAWAQWRMGLLEWGPVAFGCPLCIARRGGGGQRVWVYRPRWRRVCAQHGRWLLDAGEGHAWPCVDIGALMPEPARAQRRWALLARRSAGAPEPVQVFALARAVVCGWWEQEAFWERERLWGLRLEQVVAATRQYPSAPGWSEQQWRLVARDAVVFPEVVAVASALADPGLQQLAAGNGPGGLVRGRGGGERFFTALGGRLGRTWLHEVEHASRPSPLTAWAKALARHTRRPPEASPGPERRGVWWVRTVYQPLEVGAGLHQSSDSAGTRPAGGGEAEVPERWRQERVVPRRAGNGAGLARRHEQLFAEGLEHARAYAGRYGHLAVAHTDRPDTGFDLGRWMANRRADADALTQEQARQLAELDRWWNPPWPISWQRAWHRAHTYTRTHGPIHGGASLAGLPRWLARWLQQQITHYPYLHPGQQELLAQLGWNAREVERYEVRPGRRRPVADALDHARAYAARYGHLAVSQPTTHNGFQLGKWLNLQRHRQHTTHRPTPLGRHLTTIDTWWNPPWPVAWQRTWWAARHHHTGLPHGLAWWPGAPDAQQATTWLHEQIARRRHLHPGQQQLLDELHKIAAAPGTSSPARRPDPVCSAALTAGAPLRSRRTV
ncbi:Helicase associated domain protein [Streptomyces sp. NPDC054775]